MTATEVTKVDPVGLAAQLIDAGHADTVYRAVYLQRARTLLGGVFSMEEFGIPRRRRPSSSGSRSRSAARWKRPTGRGSRS